MTKQLILNLIKTDVIINTTEDKLWTNGLEILIIECSDGVY